MNPIPSPLIEALRREARRSAENAYVPYSRRPGAVLLLLSDGSWIPGVRVECASFPITLPALLNGFSTAVAAGRTDVRAVAGSEPLAPEDLLYAERVLPGARALAAPDLLVLAPGAALPLLAARLDPFLPDATPSGDAEGVALARRAAGRARVPESAFPVGAVVQTGAGRLVPGCNVEQAEWPLILCAERNALGTAVSYGERDLHTLYLSCTRAPGCSPCGACRQLVAELMPLGRVVMDRGGLPPTSSTPDRLLPGSFTGEGLG